MGQLAYCRLAKLAFLIASVGMGDDLMSQAFETATSPRMRAPNML